MNRLVLFFAFHRSYGDLAVLLQAQERDQIVLRGSSFEGIVDRETRKALSTESRNLKRRCKSDARER